MANYYLFGLFLLVNYHDSVFSGFHQFLKVILFAAKRTQNTLPKLLFIYDISSIYYSLLCSNIDCTTKIVGYIFDLTVALMYMQYNNSIL